MSYIIRPWALRDVKDVMRLIREAAKFHKASDQVKTTPEALQQDGFGAHPKFGCLVAEVPPEQRSGDDSTEHPSERISALGKGSLDNQPPRPRGGCISAPVSPGQAILGYQFHYFTYCTWEGRILFGEDLYVRPEFRGKGIGTSLLRKVAQVALANGCAQFRVVSANWNGPATALYEKLGAVDMTAQESWNLWHIEGPAVREMAAGAAR